MSDRVQSPNRAAAAPALRLSAVGSRILQRKCSCGGGASSEGECESCRKEQVTLQRFASGRSAPATVPPVVHRVLRSSGRPLDPDTRALLEPRFGHDFGKVRIHTDDEAAKSAKAVHAVAYTVGHQVAFSTDHYAPETKAGLWLLAHELAHVVQQSGCSSGRTDGHATSRLELGQTGGRAEQEASQVADVVTGSRHSFASPAGLRATEQGIQRESESDWNEYYRQRDKKIRSHVQKPYEEYKSGLGEIRPTSEGGLTQNLGRWEPKFASTMSLRAEQARSAQGKPVLGFPAPHEITLDMLKEIYPDFAQDIATDDPRAKKANENEPSKAEKAARYCKSLNQAFKVMKINTVEAQADYLAHAYVESDQFRQFTETQGSKDVEGRPVQIPDPACVAKGKKSQDCLIRNPEAGPPQRWIDPETVKPPKGSTEITKGLPGGLNERWLNEHYDPNEEGPTAKNPKGSFAFIGRGPVQVTHRAEYVEVIAMLEKAAEQYYDIVVKEMRDAEAQYAKDNDLAKYGKRTDAWSELIKNAKFCREAAEAIKSNPAEAANPKYTFLVSAAFMKSKGADVTVGQGPGTRPNLSKPTDSSLNWTASSPSVQWVSGGRLPKGSVQEKALAEKANAYDRSYRVLCRESKPCREAAPQAFQDWVGKTRTPSSGTSP